MSKDNKLPWNSWSDIPETLRKEFEQEIKQNNEKIAKGEIEPLELTGKETMKIALQDPKFMEALKRSVEQIKRGEVVEVDDDFFE